jgi:hypothetical protein
MTTTTTGEAPAATRSTTSKGAGDGASPGTEPGRIAGVRQSAAEAYQAARERTGSAYSTARDRAGDAYQTARRRTADGIDSNPLAAVFGGLALGAVAAALLPRTRREEALLGDVGRRLGDTAREAARAAREAGKDQIVELGLDKAGVRRRLDEFTDRAVGKGRGSAGKGKAKG